MSQTPPVELLLELDELLLELDELLLLLLLLELSSPELLLLDPSLLLELVVSPRGPELVDSTLPELVLLPEVVASSEV